ncbi:MAG: carboxypeptidase-like regulatory domain-containing protein [Pyrinomonadaceae bacterium]
MRVVSPFWLVQNGGGAFDVFITKLAAKVVVSGALRAPDGRGIRNATVSISDAQGNVRTTATSSFGFYSFDNVASGAQYTIRVAAKRYRFSSRVLQINANLTDIDFVAVE